MTDQIKKHIAAIWQELNGLRAEALDMQPGEHKEIVINLTGYLVQDVRYMSHKLGVELK